MRTKILITNQFYNFENEEYVLVEAAVVEWVRAPI